LWGGRHDPARRLRILYRLRVYRGLQLTWLGNAGSA
jgi:hypothetical protein